MNPLWQQLTDLDPNGPLPSDAETLLSNSALVPLQQYGFIAADGPDSHQFLQGQTTCDFRQVSTDLAQSGAYCTPKGRMLTSFVAAGLNEQDLLLRMRADVVTNTLAVLGKYAVFSKVELRDAGDGFLGIGLAGKRARAVLTDSLGAAPTQRNAVVAVAGGLALQLDNTGERFELWLGAETAETHWKKLATAATLAPACFWDWVNLRAGVADVCADTVEAFLPQMLNYDLTGAVNFKKGCYTGQEVVARLHYRGSAKRRLFIGKTDADPKPGDTVMAGEGSQSVGTVASAVRLPEHSELGVVLSLEAAERADLHVAGAAMSVEPPPYPLDT